MARLIYSYLCSVDGFVEDREGRFGWAVPDAEVLGFVNELEAPVGTYLYGRRMYQTMVGWETDPSLAQASEGNRDFAAMWQRAEKIVYSGTLQERDVVTRRTRIERAFDPEAVRRLKAEAATDLSMGGAGLAAHALRAGLVDELQLFLAPVIVGAGKALLPEGVRLDLTLLDERRFANGMAYLRYGVRPG